MKSERIPLEPAPRRANKGGGHIPFIEPVSLEAARVATLALLLAEEEFCAAVIAANKSGNSTRQLERVLGISHQKINKIVNGHSRLSLSY